MAEWRTHSCGDFNNWSRRRSREERFAAHLAGARAEYAASVLLFTSEPKWHYVPGEPDLWDARWNRWIEVKWIAKRSHRLIVQRRCPKVWLGVWVWVVCLCGTENRIVYFRRWVDEFANGSPELDNEGRNYVVKSLIRSV